MTMEQKIKMMMAHAGLNQTSLASKLGITRQGLAIKLKRGYFEISELDKIAEACNAKFVSFFEFPDGFKI